MHDCLRSPVPSSRHSKGRTTLKPAGCLRRADRPKPPYPPRQMSDKCYAVSGLSGQRSDEGRLSWQAKANSRPLAVVAHSGQRTFRNVYASD